MDVTRIREALTRAGTAGPPSLEVLWPGAVAAAAASTVGLVSGSFDPLTVAHAALAGALLRRADLVLLVYAARTLPKEAGGAAQAAPPALLPPEDRVASLLAYARGHRGIGVAVASHGLLADQAQAAHHALPGAELLVGLGSDKLVQLFDPVWYDDREAALERLFEAAGVAYAVRSGDEETVARTLSDNHRWADRVERLDLPDAVSDVAARRVREAAARGAEIRRLVPEEVLPFLRGGGSAPGG